MSRVSFSRSCFIACVRPWLGVTHEKVKADSQLCRLLWYRAVWAKMDAPRMFNIAIQPCSQRDPTSPARLVGSFVKQDILEEVELDWKILFADAIHRGPGRANLIGWVATGMASMKRVGNEKTTKTRKWSIRESLQENFRYGWSGPSLTAEQRVQYSIVNTQLRSKEGRGDIISEITACCDPFGVQYDLLRVI